MPSSFMSDVQYFPGYIGNPIAFIEGAVYSPYGMGVHRRRDTVTYETIWVDCNSRELQLEFPWGAMFGAIQAGESLSKSAA